MPEQFTLHHREVQEIMGRMPNWILRWASAGLLAGFLLLGLAASLVRLPDQVVATVRLTQARPPAAAQEAWATVAVGQVAVLRPGQPVLIDLQAYPARQYGYLAATVGRVLPLTSVREAVVQLQLRPGNRTTTGRVLAKQPLLAGQGLITVSESSLLQRVLR